MATNKSFSFAAFASYGNSSANAATTFQNAFVTDAKKFYAKAGYPSKDEIGILDEIKPDVTNTTAAIPELVSGFMHDEQRKFDLPAPDDKTSPATISVKSVDKKVKEGVISIEGPNKGKTYKTTIAAHEEVAVKNNNKAFKS